MMALIQSLFFLLKEALTRHMTYACLLTQAAPKIFLDTYSLMQLFKNEKEKKRLRRQTDL